VRARIADPLATAFGNTFWWAVGMSAVALIPAAIRAVSQWRDRRARTVAGAEGAARLSGRTGGPRGGAD
jgi:hypothetical protein